MTAASSSLEHDGTSSSQNTRPDLSRPANDTSLSQETIVYDGVNSPGPPTLASFPSDQNTLVSALSAQMSAQMSHQSQYQSSPSSKKGTPHHTRASSGLSVEIHRKAWPPRRQDYEFHDDGGEPQKQSFSVETSPTDPVQHQQRTRSSYFSPSRFSRHSSRQASRHSSRQPSRQRQDYEEQELSEMAAPAPVQEEDQSGQWRKEEHLEEGGSAANQTDPSEPGQARPDARLTQLYTISYLVFFSFWGTLARLGVQWLGFYPGALVVISNLWANFGGCLLMGVLSEDQNLFGEHRPTLSLTHLIRHRSKRSDDTSQQSTPNEDTASMPRLPKRKIPLFTGLTVGFCGCFTSFSTFARDMFFALANDVATPINHPTDTSKVSATVTRNNAWSICAVLAVIILTVTVSIAALQFGAHIAIAASRVIPPIPQRFLRYFLDPLMVVLAICCWLGAIFLAIFPADSPSGPDARGPTYISEVWRGECLFALVFAPVGCLVRYFVSKYLNPRLPNFPLGTFVCNMVGVAILAMCYDIQHTSAAAVWMGRVMGGYGNQISCQVLQGLQDGLSGCLTTVSTWVLELTTLRMGKAYLYGSVSVGTALATGVLLFGSVEWSVGFGSLACRVEVS